MSAPDEPTLANVGLRLQARRQESDAIAEELASYNPLIPDGTNLKATLMLEYPDVAERRAALEKLAGVEHGIYVEVRDLDSTNGTFVNGTRTTRAVLKDGDRLGVGRVELVVDLVIG